MDSPVGRLELCSSDGVMVSLHPTDDLPTRTDDPLLCECRDELQAYFSGNLRRFTVPLAKASTPFRAAVEEALLDTPYGTVVTYGDIARAVGKPFAARAVGQAVHRNQLCILIPCHRVIGANGFVTGYAWGYEMKAKLLQLEAAYLPALLD